MGFSRSFRGFQRFTNPKRALIRACRQDLGMRHLSFVVIASLARASYAERMERTYMKAASRHASEAIREPYGPLNLYFKCMKKQHKEVNISIN